VGANNLVPDFFPRQVVARHSTFINASAEQVWRIVGDVGSNVVGAGLIERIEVIGSGTGAVRRLYLHGGAIVEERIEHYDDQGRRYIYRITDAGPTGLARYLGLVEVIGAGEVKSILSWTAMADPVGIDAKALQAGLDGNVSHAVEAVARHFEAAGI
jgi:hypothetical protein